MADVGVMVEAQEDLTWERWRRVVADAERFGFVSLRVSDHLESVMGIEGRRGVPAWTGLAIAAELTERIELGTMVSPATFYQPGVLLREAVAVDQLSGGRVILGLGAGWNEREHEHFEVPFGDWRFRFDRLEGALELIKRLNRTLPDARELPVLLGGSGARRSLPLAARYASEWNGGGPGADAYRQRCAALDAACQAVGRDPKQVRRSFMSSFLIGRNDAELRERAVELQKVLAWLGGETPDEIVEEARSHWPAVGTPEQIVARLQPYREAGVERFLFQHFLHLDTEGLELLGREVAPALA